MSVNVFLNQRKLLLGGIYVKLLQCNHYHARELHDGKAEIFGTSQSGGEESASQKVERFSYKVLAKVIDTFETIRSSNEVSVSKAIASKTWRVSKGALKKYVMDNSRVIAMQRDFKQKLEEAREKENRN